MGNDWLTFPEDGLDLCLPLHVDSDGDHGGGPGSWLAGVLAAVLQLDVLDDESGPVSTLHVPGQLLDSARLPAVELDNLNNQEDIL